MEIIKFDIDLGVLYYEPEKWYLHYGCCDNLSPTKECSLCTGEYELPIIKELKRIAAAPIAPAPHPIFPRF